MIVMRHTRMRKMRLKRTGIEARMWLEELVRLGKDLDQVSNFQNAEISMQHSTSHVPSQAIPMNTFHQHPEETEEIRWKIFFSTY